MTYRNVVFRKRNHSDDPSALQILNFLNERAAQEALSSAYHVYPHDIFYRVIRIDLDTSKAADSGYLGDYFAEFVSALY